MRQVPRVVLDAVAVANLADHLEVEHRPLVQALRLEQLPFALELRAALDELRLDRLDGFLQARARRDEVRLRIDGNPVVPLRRLAGERVERRELVDLVAEEADPQRVLLVGGIDLDDVAADAKRAAPELVIVALVLNLDQLAENLVPVHALTGFERQQHPVIRVG
jgi:hypothetical protein